MSGHSKWSTIKRQKESKDAEKGKVFGKLSRAISLAAKSGGDPDANPRLRMLIDQARAVNMPNTNIERAIQKGSSADTQLTEVVYEGFGPGGVGVIVEAATDNKNRTAQEIKNAFDRAGGSLGEPGSVAFNFTPTGQIVVQRAGDLDSQILALIDLGVEDVEEAGETLEVFMTPSEIAEVKDKIEKAGFSIDSVELVRKPKSYIMISDRDTARRAISLLESLEESDDVQRVYSNADVPEDVSN